MVYPNPGGCLASFILLLLLFFSLGYGTSFCPWTAHSRTFFLSFGSLGLWVCVSHRTSTDDCRRKSRLYYGEEQLIE